MKTLEELRAIRENTLKNINVRKDDKSAIIRIVVGMATCGIAAGARPVMQAFIEEAALRGLNHVQITQTGCIGLCRYEPMADVFIPGQEKVTYINLTPEKAKRIVLEHIVNGNPVIEYAIGSAENNK
ncbi:MAG: (2Fe-2S) ferredoxin domain-containing protein [Eubacteriales bacterium]|nr:(2Fe-2S) ferredoxin domain-containing protein [Eubacteriales bacterium]